uniref:O-methyltransferase domain-containing protein n=1 Tax=Bionectria ochroleuca TaxID=29856 RepID=A0A8H7K1D9_BIOOC
MHFLKRLSRFLACRTMRASVRMIVAPAAVKWAESLKKFPGSEKTGESGFSIANGSQEGFFSSLDKDTKRRTRFAKGQALLMDHPARDPIHLVNSLDWSGKDCPKTVIDIGGSHGRLMEAILRNSPRFNRVWFKTCQGWWTELLVILHDWPDADAIRILRNQISVLEVGDWIIFNEGVMEGVIEDKAFQDQMQRCSDIMMHELFNAKERSKDEWVAFFAAADPRFKVESFIKSPSAVLSTIIVIWTG